MALLLFVHAHPDDETLATGTTLAHYVAAGDEVHVLTCTLGEEGEVIPPELSHLDSAHDDTLGAFRREELREAMRRLGVHHAVLDGYRDSGMAGMPSAQHPHAFARADLDEVSKRVAEHILELAPHVVVTYEEHGGYGHPDHIQTHRATMRALAGLGRHAPELVYEIRTPRSWVHEDRKWLWDNVIPSPGLALPALNDPLPPSVVPDEQVSHAVIDPAAGPALQHALAAHRTQVRVFGDYYALSNGIAARLSGREGFTLVDPTIGDALGAGPPARHTGLLGETRA